MNPSAGMLHSGHGYRIYGGPRRYIQGRDALQDLGTVARELGSRAVVVLDSRVLELFGERIQALLADAGVHARLCPHDGEVSREALTCLGESIADEGHQVVIGVGGGKALDSAKFVSRGGNHRLLLVPTLASNDAPTSRAIVLFDEHHHLVGLEYTRWNPDVVLVDTAIIASAPVRFFVAGIGDAIAKKFEADASSRAGLTNFFGGRPPLAGRCLAAESYAVLRRQGVAACRAVRRGEVNGAVEDVVEASLLLSGLGFENSGLFLAHSLTRGFALFPETHDCLHGELVAFGVLVQLVQERRPREQVLELLRFYADVGLPACLAAVGLAEADDSCLERIAAAALETRYMRELGGRLDAGALAEHIRSVDRIAAEEGSSRPCG